ncbi:hypothetical protein DUNSADRAFT_9377 [Dunaliella salina]|uniref:Encoded protein n=1 Tax=Dunaliella salina TaxID=3046 RepID=A0ABQ7GHL2_DUNSA|nr:hypothetical protein DUNSADRAFT_9377 [Dunaliella salina]|eukprot:KAF5834100.1 hypothetical protein DUNSADRAFT_9377 [Dunaliella salina]
MKETCGLDVLLAAAVSVSNTVGVCLHYFSMNLNKGGDRNGRSLSSPILASQSQRDVDLLALMPLYASQELEDQLQRTFAIAVLGIVVFLVGVSIITE